jgi:hypothetical protein
VQDAIESDTLSPRRVGHGYKQKSTQEHALQHIPELWIRQSQAKGLLHKGPV